MPFPAVLVTKPSSAALMPDPVGHRAIAPSVQLTSSQLCNPSAVKALSLNCGGSTPYLEKDGPRGYPTPPCDEVGYPRDNPLSGKSPMTPSQRCAGTVDGLSQTVSGVTPPFTSPETNDPGGHSNQPSVIEVHPRGEPLPDQSPMTLSQRCTGTKDWILNPVCGVTSPFHPYHLSAFAAFSRRHPQQR